MAKTANQVVSHKDAGGLMAFPVASGETIYQGCLVAVDETGYLYNLTAAIAPYARLIGIVADDSDNASGPAATTSAGSISGATEQASAVAGDKTVRNIWTSGRFLLTGATFSQATVGLNVYASDNFTVGTTSGSGYVCIGMCVAYIDSTHCWVDLNNTRLSDYSYMLRGSLAFSATTIGTCCGITNPMASTLLIENFIVDITTASGTTTLYADIGVSASTTTTSDTLMDAVYFATANTQTSHVSGGTNGLGVAKWGSTYYVTGTCTTSSTVAVATYAIIYRQFT